MSDDAATAAREAAVARFVALAFQAGPEGPPLDEAALEIAAAAAPLPDPRAAASAELDRLADGVEDLPGLVRRLYGEEGFAGDTVDYGDPRNSSLAQVLRRRRGIPVTLAVVAVAVGRRAGVLLHPVGMPGHFLVRPDGEDPSGRHLDPFTGRMVDLAGVEALFRASTGAGPGVPFGPEYLPVLDVESVLVRMLANLRAGHRRTGRLDELRWVLEMRLALGGVEAAEVLELAEARGRRAEYGPAARLLEAWAQRLPSDAARLRRTARSWRAHLN